MTGRRLILGLLVLAAIGVGVYFLVAALSGAETTTSSGSTASGDTPVVTGISMDLDLTWSPPEAIPDPDRRTISDTLDHYGVQALFPSPAPDVVDGPLSGGVWVTRTVPTDFVDVTVFVRNEDGQPLLSVTSGDSTWTGSEDWAEVQVRGEPGRFYDNSVGVRFLTWKEGGRTYSVEFGDLLTLDQATTWLDSWYTLP
jgi:hypothetical protein